VVFKYPILIATLFAGIASAQVTTPGGPPSRPNCEALVGFVIPADHIGLPTSGATVTSAALVAATSQTVAPNGDIVLPLPEHCRVQGTIAPVDPNAPVINYNVNLPSNWNGKAMHSGGGGFHGFVATAPGQKGSGYFDPQPFFDPYPLTRGYVTFGGDSGHVGGNAVFALNDEALQNFGYASLKKTHDVAVEIMKQAYGQRHRYMYFNGESNGGRDALIVAQRFPKDYDGIIATSPVLSWTYQHTSFGLWRTQQIDGGWMNEAKIKLIADKSRAACDANDGLADGILAKYDECVVNPNALRCPDGIDAGDHCLSDAQIEMVHLIREPWTLPFDLANGVKRFPGYGVTGGEDEREQWSAFMLGTAPPSYPLPPGDSGVEPMRSRLVNFGTTWIRYAIAQDPAFEPYRFYANEYKDRIQYLSTITDATDPDLSDFRKRGGKLLLISHSADNAAPTRVVAEYYNSVVAALGEHHTERFIRFYVTHGGAHDAWNAPAKVDALGILEQWVERDVRPPESPTAYHMNPDSLSVIRTMPACRYPAYAHYSGGDPNAAESFTCTPRRDPLAFPDAKTNKKSKEDD
jgi:hypothetical protein